MYKRILVPVDGSRASTLGLHEALRLAKDQKARLRAVHVVDEAVVVQYPETAADANEDLIKRMTADGKKTLDHAMKLAEQYGVKAECVLHKKLLGPLADLILKEAKTWRADLIVMGTHAHRGLKRFLLGSDAESIARSSRLPVMLIHGPERRKRAVRHLH